MWNQPFLDPVPQVVTTPVKHRRPGLVECLGAHRRWVDHGLALHDDTLPVGTGHFFDRRSRLAIDLVTLSAVPQVLSNKVYLPLVREPQVVRVEPRYVQIGPGTPLPPLRITGSGINTALDGCCTISTDQAAGTIKEDRLKVMTRPTFLYRISGAPPKSWRLQALPEGPFTARCDLPADVVEMVSRKIYVTYSPNCKQFPAEGHMINLMIAPTLRRIWPYEVILDVLRPARITAFGAGFLGLPDLRLRLAGRLVTGLQAS
ncbi:unnamed protein product [Symbiodinium pilosum]|uniref:Uncharacterized protein n=1 Tax=Symbiodinium pilosum TaxID=2952 RepID=A0A812WAC5_SYMPI|nr:unnamed protein product [Symbiodinium pilosum]